MTAIDYNRVRRRWEPVRDTSNPSRDALARGRTSFTMLNQLRSASLRGRPLAKLCKAEAAIAHRQGLAEQAERDARAALQNHAFVMDSFNRLLGIAA
jgi:hypothetical protein